MASSILTLFCNNPIQSGSNAGLLDLTAPAASTSTTIWTVGKKAAGQSSLLSYNNTTAGFGATLQPAGAPTNLAQDCWRISANTTGKFSAGTWYSGLSILASTAGGTGRARFRIWRSANADGTTATELTAGTMVGTTVTPSTTIAATSSASTQIVASNLTNEYLFLQCGWEVVTAGGANADNVQVLLGNTNTNINISGLVTSAFSSIALAVARGSFLNSYYRAQVQGLV